MDSSSGGTYDSDHELKLDPGVSARRNRSSGCKCIFIVVVTTFGLLAAVFIGISIVTRLHSVWEPHAALLYKKKSADPVDPAAIIRPLIDTKQTFDIVATVWLRTNGSSPGSAIPTLPTEKAIFTGTVFQGLRLKDKGIHATVNYTVPTEIFKNRDLKHYDLRASFVLIPTSPSLLDNLTKYSSWRNEIIPLPPFRSWPDTGPAPTLQDKAIDSFGVSIGLIDFFGIRSRCGPSTSNTSNALEYTPFEDDFDDEDSDDETDDDNLSQNSNSSITAHSSSKGRPVLESHPYIISHSFIRVVEMTKLFDRKAYNKAHKKLETNACGLGSSPPNYDWKLCNQALHENMDTRLQLKMTEGGNRNVTKTHWAYAPHLTLARSAWTPKDLVAVPVNREDCIKGGRFNDSEPLVPDQDFVDITWKIVYSGRTSFKLGLSESLSSLNVYHNMTAEEEIQQDMQVISEVIQGLRGNRSSTDDHPRRIFFRKLLVIVIGIIIKLIDIRYWYTRSSTIGISRFATILVAVITLGNYLLNNLSLDIQTFWIHLLLAIAWLPYELSPFLMLKAVWRLEFVWNQKKGKGKWTEKLKRWLPSVHFAKATHGERASSRLDARTLWTVKLSLFVSSCLAYFFFSPSTSLFLISPLGLAPKFELDESWQLHNTIKQSLIFPGLIIGSGLQLWFNHQSRTFAGKYKLSAILEGIILMFDMLRFSTRVLGIRRVRDGFSVHDFVNAFLVVVWCYQAAMLPTVRQGEVDEEVE